MLETAAAAHCLALVETTIFHESDDAFHEHIAWDVVGPLMVGVGVGVVSYGIRRFFEWLGLRRRRRRLAEAERMAVRRAVLYMLEQRADAGDREAKEILDDLRKEKLEWR